ncbi:tRNA-splicing endonuclease subunit Sen2 isoform X2 [Anoplophora glabripennis]|uniref:tRNA-splicing endonuclease subunit Sen2 isoform X2 n=1 Tax=Anoplophora glabripennis TaxID=217634 RepID=UPI000873CD64|nr:tRNA-splicing endonuclease subunit Sen2 isoform X2 [Anoplophora glabripennis]
MELIEPKPKKHCRLPQNIPLPVILKKDGTLYKFKGIFNDFCVIVEDEQDMKNIISMGYFGKANLSRSYPQFNQSKTEIIRERQYKRRKDWAKKNSNKKSKKKVIVVPDSDEEKYYFINLQPQYQIDESNVKETVWLSLEESFFLSSIVKCLHVYYEGKSLRIDEMWTMFSATDPHFIQNYIVYYHFKAKNWVVKPGIKFGGDFLLYKQGPPFYHASYVVVIDIVNENLERIEHFSRRSMDNVPLLSLNRLCETAGKELLICQVIWPQNVHIDYKNIADVIIKENVMRRWISSQERIAEDT